MSRLRTPASHPTAGVSPPFSTEPPKSGRLSSVSTKPPNSGCLSSVLRRATQQRVSRLRTTVQSSSQCIDASRPSGLRPPVCRLARTPQVGHPAFGLRFADLLRLRKSAIRPSASGMPTCSDSVPSRLASYGVARRDTGLRQATRLLRNGSSSDASPPPAFGLRLVGLARLRKPAPRPSASGHRLLRLRLDSPPAEWLVPTPDSVGTRLLRSGSSRPRPDSPPTEWLVAVPNQSRVAHPQADRRPSAFGYPACSRTQVGGRPSA